MEFPDTTLNSALTDHLTTRFVQLSRLPSDEFNDMSRHREPAYNLPRRLLLSLNSKIKDCKGDNFIVHSGYQTPDLLSMDPDSAVNRNLAADTLNQCRDFVNILKMSLRKSTLLKTHAVCNQEEIKLSGFTQLPSDIPEELLSNYCRLAMWQRFVDSATDSGSSGLAWTQVPGAWTNKNITIILVKGKQVVLPHNALLMLKDIVWGRFLSHVYSYIDPAKSELKDLTDFILQWGFISLRRYGDHGYNLIKMIEPICTAKLIQLSETTLDPDYQLANMADKYRKKELMMIEELQTPGVVQDRMIADILLEHLNLITDPELVSEVFSLNRIVGHPYIDPIAGSEALKKLASAPSTATYSGIKAVGWSFCHMFTKGYIDKMHKWPPMVFNMPEGYQSLLRDMCEQEHSPLPLGLSIYDPSDWDYVTFLPISDFDYGEDILSLMTDKSLSFKRSEIDNSWRGRLPYTPKKATSSNRVLHELLTRDLDMKEICDFFSSGDLPYDWLVVVIHPKEREPKMPAPRMFAIMDIHPRSFFCLLEKNLAEKIFPYIPEQTMTMNQQEEEESFLSITRPSLNSKTLSIGLDLAKWCSHFRKKTVSMVSDRLNQLLGVTNLYGSVHDFFSKCIKILRHFSFTPTQDTKNKKGHLVDEPGIYSGHEAGLEGTQQKLWTLITLCMLHWAVWRFGCSYKITCQGDNLVIHILVMKLQDETDGAFKNRVRALNEKVLKSIEVAASMIGHEVNPDECFSSTSFTTYGKNMWFEGRKLPTILKVATRMFPKTTSDTPSTESIIANIAATGTSMVERSQDVLASFFFTKFVEYLVIGRETKMSLIHKRRIGADPNSFVWSWTKTGGSMLCGLVPSNLGGFPVSCLAEFLYRGHSDPLSSSLGSLVMFEHIPIVKKYVLYLSSTLLVRDLRDNNSSEANRERETLIRDPYSVPLRSIPGAFIRTTELISETLSKITQNTMLRPIVKISTDKKEEQKLLASLLSSKPVNPKVLHEIHKCSVFGVAAAMSRRFTDTRTIRRITCKGDVDIVSAHIQNDLLHIISVFKNFRNVIESPPPPHSSTRPYQLLVQMREKWGLGRLDGVTNYHPLIAGSWIPTSYANQKELTSIISDETNPLIVCMSLTSTVKECLTKRGKVQPFLGSQTSEKAISKWVKPINASPPLKDALRLIQIAKLCTSPESHLRVLIDSLARERTSLPMELLYEMAKESIGGTVSHRLNTSVATQGSRIASLPNWSTHMSISSNLSREMGANDYPVSFAEYYLTILCVSKWFYEDSEVVPPFGVLQLIDLSELQPVQDMTIDIPESITLKKLYVPMNSYYLYATSVHLSSRNKIGMKLPLEEIKEGEPTPFDGLSQLLLQSITSNKRMVRKKGYDRSQIEKRLQVDLPEASLITKDEYLNSAACALLLFSSRQIINRTNSAVPLLDTITTVLLQSALRMSPVIISTISVSDNNDDEMLRVSAGSWTMERSVIRLACLLVSSATNILHDTTTRLPLIFCKTTSSMSSLLASRLFMQVLFFMIRGQASVLSCKFLSRLIGTILNRQTESLQVSGLCNLITILEWNDRIFLTDSAAETIVRTLRGRVASPEFSRRKHSYLLPQVPDALFTATGQLSIVDVPSSQMSSEELISSWAQRPFPGRSDSWLKWSPLHNLIRDGSKVYVIGIGAGGIISCIPRNCEIYGMDLPKVVENLGQSFVNYKTTTFHLNYSTRPITWLQDLSTLDQHSVEMIIDDIKITGSDVVIIDVDVVDPRVRLSLRHTIASNCCDCWVRVHSSKQGVHEVVRSFLSLKEASDNWWVPSISNGKEVIIGRSSRPLGLYSVVEKDQPPDRIIKEVYSSPTWDELVEFVLHFGGEVNDTHDIPIFLRRRRVGGLSLLNLYTECITSPSEALVAVGRFGCRLLLSVVPWYL